MNRRHRHRDQIKIIFKLEWKRSKLGPMPGGIIVDIRA